MTNPNKKVITSLSEALKTVYERRDSSLHDYVVANGKGDEPGDAAEVPHHDGMEHYEKLLDDCEELSLEPGESLADAAREEEWSYPDEDEVLCVYKGGKKYAVVPFDDWSIYATVCFGDE